MVLDLGVGNVGSIVNMLRFIGVDSTVVRSGCDADKRVPLRAVSAYLAAYGDLAFIALDCNGLHPIAYH